jgi:hypothetical protein
MNSKHSLSDAINALKEGSRDSLLIAPHLWNFLAELRNKACEYKGDYYADVVAMYAAMDVFTKALALYVCGPQSEGSAQFQKTLRFVHEQVDDLIKKTHAEMAEPGQTIVKVDLDEVDGQ